MSVYSRSFSQGPAWWKVDCTVIASEKNVCDVLCLFLFNLRWWFRWYILMTSTPDQDKNYTAPYAFSISPRLLPHSYSTWETKNTAAIPCKVIKRKCSRLISVLIPLLPGTFPCHHSLSVVTRCWAASHRFGVQGINSWTRLHCRRKYLFYTGIMESAFGVKMSGFTPKIRCRLTLSLANTVYTFLSLCF